MNNIFLIFGYGVPKNILKDENYNLYLKMAFNKIYNISFISKINPIIICSGGKTDCYKPCKRTEADEIIKLFKNIVKKPFLTKITQNWLFIAEKKSLSTLENLLNCQEILKNKSIKQNNANIYIFCEQTREKRIKTLAKKVLGKNYNLKIIPIDFDISSNRYVNPEFLAKKEHLGLKSALWALQNPENLQKYRESFKEKIDFLRKKGAKNQPEAVKKWWEQKIKNCK